MVQKDTQSDKAAPPNLFPAGLAELGQKRVEAAMEAQKAILDEMQDVNSHLVERAKSEAALATELVNKLTAARTVPDALAAWQQWGRRRMEMASEDGQWVLSNSFKLMETSARVFSDQASARV